MSFPRAIKQVDISGGNTRFGLSTETIRLRLILIMMIGGVLIAALVTFAWLPRVKSILIDQQETLVGQQLDMIGDSILPFLIQGQFGAIYETLERVQSRNPSWIEINLKGANGNHLYPLRAQTPRFSELGQLVTREISVNGNAIAQISARVDLAGVVGVLQRDAWKMGASLTAFFLTFLIVLVWMLDVIIVRRLMHLTVVAKELSNGNFQYSLPRVNNDEIGKLTESFDKMRHNVELTTLSLQKSQTSAERALAAKNDFLARMSHELLTPLNGIIPMAELLTLGETDHSKLQKLDTIRTSARHVLTTVENILTVSDAEIGTYEIRATTFKLAHLARSLETILRPEALKKGLEFAVRVDRTFDPMATADLSMIQRVVVAIGQNAIKFTDHGSVKIDLSFHQSAATETVHLLAKVSDTGIGIDPGHHTAIFDKFFQVNSGKTRGKDGAGLGLSIADSLIRCLGGKIVVESDLGKGSLFLIDIPIQKAD